MDWLFFVFGFFCLFPIWGALVWEIWQGHIRPAIIGQNLIQSEINQLYTQYGNNVFDYVCRREHRAIYQCDSYKIGYWRRIRREIMWRERQEGYTFKRVK